MLLTFLWPTSIAKLLGNHRSKTILILFLLHGTPSLQERSVFEVALVIFPPCHFTRFHEKLSNFLLQTIIESLLGLGTSLHTNDNDTTPLHNFDTFRNPFFLVKKCP
eukprot:Lithocolla_globosa_v1_NODE_657_length_3498_cov_11.605286.p3 type:complete len:107 gc:universal NODE_657_length_3498_cov_11.605286:1454-1134(-)